MLGSKPSQPARGKATPSAGQTESAPNLRSLLEAAHDDMRASGTYIGLGRALDTTIGSPSVYQAAGTSERVPETDRAEAVMDLYAGNTKVVFAGSTPRNEDRDFVVGDSSRSVEAVVIPTEPVDLEDGEVASSILVARDGGGLQANDWELREVDTSVADAIASLRFPELEAIFKLKDLMETSTAEEALEAVRDLVESEKTEAEETEAGDDTDE